MVPFVVACSDDNKPACAAPGSAVSGAADTHCGTNAVTVDPAACSVPDAGATDGGTTGGSDFGETMFNAEGDDDDCKYHIKWTATAICENSNVTFAITVTHKVDGSAVTGAHPSAEVFLGDTHAAPNSNQSSTELGGGRYNIGPVRFDLPGQWTVRFHVFETCHDSEQSPHGHGAFFVSVP